jgi:hypothetical protein
MLAGGGETMSEIRRGDKGVGTPLDKVRPTADIAGPSGPGPGA